MHRITATLFLFYSLVALLVVLEDLLRDSSLDMSMQRG